LCSRVRMCSAGSRRRTRAIEHALCSTAAGRRGGQPAPDVAPFVEAGVSVLTRCKSKPITEWVTRVAVLRDIRKSGQHLYLCPPLLGKTPKTLTGASICSAAFDSVDSLICPIVALICLLCTLLRSPRGSRDSSLRWAPRVSRFSSAVGARLTAIAQQLGTLSGALSSSLLRCEAGTGAHACAQCEKEEHGAGWARVV